MLGPDFPFAYDEWLSSAHGLGEIPEAEFGTPVAVIGAGISGLVAAYELLRLGLRPVVYETGQMGGRMRSAAFDSHPDAVAELGAMRFPASALALRHYLDLVGLETRPFPNPLTAASGSTVVALGGDRHYARRATELPDIYQEVGMAWDKTLQEHAELFAMDDAIRRRDTAAIKAIWNPLVRALDDQSFYGFIANSPSFQSFKYREIFGQVGFGAGGWDTDFPNSMLEILRVVYTGAEDDHRLVVGGSQQLPLRLWSHAPDDAAHWPTGTSLESLHRGGPRGGVARIERTARGITVQEHGGASQAFPAAVFTPHKRTLVTNVRCDRALLPTPVWTAVERSHYMGSSKLFVLVDRPFWRERDPRTGRDVMSTTLTDRMPRGVYLFDDGPDRPGVMCLSYTWNDDSLKMAPLTPEERLDGVLDVLADIYPGVDIRSRVIAPPRTVTWETDPHFQGAFKANLPGHYRYQRRLFTHFMQAELTPRQRGFFLAGDDVSWTAGFAEGAVTTGLNAVWGVQRHLGGATMPLNPGPGDLFADLAPVDLPED
ncbi:flavin monoamine oxidase family protein [Streptomyces flavofungini]|uniref:flavin monoamine oxidase family protein n=1 Tax=Streptomyces flavofungini TaxID=68200 RepID=UPI0025B0E871|nr:NAD(P)/FAD-dependent oxidoreductase [Streptomyces flavofungini]WJV44913.1 FAD-dependent oxidoreductase [Streptomyces flavofungini]